MLALSNMKRRINMINKLKAFMVLLMLPVLMVAGIPASFVSAKSKDTVDYLKGVECFRHSTIRIEGEKTIYFDPLMVDGEPKDGDIVFITHTHGDHYSVADIQKVLKKKGTVVITADGVAQAKKDGFKKIVSVKPGKTYEVNGISFKTVAAYNTDKDFHQKKYGWVGYNVTINHNKYYVSGDTDLTPELKKIKTDVAFLPVGGTYTMDAAQAAEAANIIKPKYAIPVHFGDIVGTTQDAAKFISLLDKSVKGTVLKDLLKGFTHINQSCVRIAAGKTIYLDPLNITGEPKDADIIFITHTHGDHLSIQDIKKIAKETTKIFVTADGEEALKKEGFTNIVLVDPSKTYEVDGISFSTVPAYNTNKEFHKKDSNWVGYIIVLSGTQYYFAGDTDIIPEMKDIKADVAFLPVGGTYTMDAKEAAQAANTIKPLVAVPYHFADVVGTVEDADTFVGLLDSSIKGEILRGR
jgi:L-ascorbate metabolism protein UlaG (beta-lactamase superfamily)